MPRQRINTEDNAWNVYCDVERVMFEAAAEYLKPYSPLALRRVLDAAETGDVETGASDVVPVIEMMLGKKEIPEGWVIPLVR